MMIEGVTGVYKKTYLNNDMYRFDYSHTIDGVLDSETGEFFDEFDNEIPFIRDINFLESKENMGHHGFLSYEELPESFNLDDLEEDEEDEYDSYLYEYDQASKSKMLLVSVLNDYDKDSKDTVLTEIDLNEIHKKAMTYYMDFVNDIGEVTSRYISTITMDAPIEDVIKLVKGGEYSIDELKLLKDIYNNPYEDAKNILSVCDLLLIEDSKGLYKESLEDRDPEFSLEDSIDINILLDMLKKHQFTIDEVKKLKDFFTVYKSELDPLIENINKELDRAHTALEEEALDDKKETEEDKEKDSVDEVIETYDLDDLKKLKDKVKEYLVGQDEPLRRLVSELSRMKDKNFEDNVGILLSGDSGVGKTFMVQLIAKYLGLPFVRVDSTDLTVPGYVGKDLEEVLCDLYEASGKDKEKAEHGIIFFDEIDKKGSNSKDDISGMGVLNHLLTLLDGADVYACKSLKGFGSSSEVKLNSKHMIIIAAGSFPDVYKSKKRSVGFNSEEEVADNSSKTPSTNVFVEKAMMSSDFMNRLPIRIRLNSLKVEDFEKNFNVGKDSPIKWEEESFLKHGVKLKVTKEFITKASSMSLKEGSGFRGAKGIILTATSDALDEIKENEGKYSEVVLTEETLDNPLVYKKVLKK